MQLIEVVRGETTDVSPEQNAIWFTRKLDKLPLPCRSAPGFVVNRILMPYINEALFALSEGIPASVIDRAGTRFGMPVIADRLAAMLPYTWEKPLGAAFDPRIRTAFGAACTQPDGVAALHTLIDRLQTAAQLPIPPEPVVLRSSIRNAFALPGGRVYVLDGLITAARTPDELGGVLAHEFGNVEHRDGLRRLLREGGTSFLVHQPRRGVWKDRDGITERLEPVCFEEERPAGPEAAQHVVEAGADRQQLGFGRALEVGAAEAKAPLETAVFVQDHASRNEGGPRQMVCQPIGNLSVFADIQHASHPFCRRCRV